MTSRPNLTAADLAASPCQRQNAMAGDLHLYFVAMSSLPLLKIGKTRKVQNRVAQLQNATPFPLHLELCFTVSDDRFETRLHRALRQFNIGNEWYYRSKFITRVIDELRMAETQKDAEMLIYKYEFEPISDNAIELDHPTMTISDVARLMTP